MGIGSKAEKLKNIVGEYGAGYLVKRSAFQAQLKKEPDREIIFEEYKELIKLTPKQEKAQRKAYADRTEKSPVFIICIEKDGGDEQLEATKDSIRCQTYLPQKVLMGNRENISQRLPEVLSKLKNRDVWVVKLTAGDCISPDMLYELGCAITSDGAPDIWYADHVTSENTAFKPDFSMDYLCSWNYIGDTFAARAALYGEKAEALYEDAYMTLLKCAAEGKTVAHLRRGYFTKKYEYENNAEEQETEALTALIYRRNCGDGLESVTVEQDGDVRNVSLNWKEDTTLSVIIPNKDHAEDLRKCLKSLSRQSIFSKMEICVVENNSTDPFTEEFYRYITGETAENLPGSLKNDELVKKLSGRVKVIRYEEKGFNYPAINNFGVGETSGEYILLLNNDVELTDSHIIERMLGQARRPDVSAVGTRLAYPDGTVQHGGVVIGMGGVADHIYTGIPAHSAGYLHGNVCTRDVSAVTAACLMVSRTDYEAVGGLDGAFLVNFNDIDLCLKLLDRGKIKIIPGDAIHYESKSRGKAPETEEQKKTYAAEVALFRERYAQILKNGDRNYNTNLTLSRKDFSCGNPFMFDM